MHSNDYIRYVLIMNHHTTLPDMVWWSVRSKVEYLTRKTKILLRKLQKDEAIHGDQLNVGKAVVIEKKVLLMRKMKIRPMHKYFQEPNRSSKRCVFLSVWFK